VTLADHDPTTVSAGLTITTEGGAVIAWLDQAAPWPPDDELVGAVAAAAATDPIVLDLSDVVLTEPAGAVTLVGTMIAAAGDPARCCVVARRASGRRLLRQWGIDRTVCLFGSVGDALQARVHSIDGYGRGWEPPQPPKSPHSPQA
jgi:anti-anti-sigma regulatory factor